MTQSHIKVTPSNLKNASTNMGKSIDAFEKNYIKLLDTVAKSAGWKGKDSEQYVKQISGFKDDLEKMVKLLRQYQDFVKYSADQYVAAQDYLYTMGQQL